jgi:hypothetical protein
MVLNRKHLTFLLGGLFILLSSQANAQCFNDPWAFANQPYSLNDVVSNDGKDWICIDAGQGHWEPSGGQGHFGWSEQSDPCATITVPVLDNATTSGLYCRTTFGNGNITASGGAAITSRGIVYSTSAGPTLSDNTVEDDYTFTGSYSCLMDNLSPGTTYYLRAYATNSEGTGYSAADAVFETDEDVDCANCNLACDRSDASLLDPVNWPGIITTSDTLCVTTDITMSDNVIVRGTVKICNDAQVTLSGSITMEGANTGFEGQIIYEGCNEKFIGTGSYTGYRTHDNSENDGDQMLSYCSSCNASDTSQFLADELVIAWWAAECRPESALLPVQLIAFSAKKQDNGALITWTTGSEINNNYFEVQTSSDGVNWVTIAIVQGAGNSSDENNYSVFDNEPTHSIQYYRLKQVDYDGTNTTSNVKTVKFDGNAKSNPIMAFTNQDNEIEVKLALNGLGTVYIIDARGRLVDQKTFISVNKNGASLKFDGSKLTKGIYFINLVSNNQRFSQKVSVIK